MAPRGAAARQRNQDWDQIIERHLDRLRGRARAGQQFGAGLRARSARVSAALPRPSSRARGAGGAQRQRLPGGDGAARDVGGEPAAPSGEHPRPGARDGRAKDPRARPGCRSQAPAASAGASAHAWPARPRDAARGDRHDHTSRQARPRDARTGVRMRPAGLGAGRAQSRPGQSRRASRGRAGQGRQGADRADRIGRGARAQELSRRARSGAAKENAARRGRRRRCSPAGWGAR